MTTDCDITLLPASQCAHCTGASELVDEGTSFLLGEGTTSFSERGRSRDASGVQVSPTRPDVKTREERENHTLRVLASDESIQTEYARTNPPTGRRGVRTWQASVRDVHEENDDGE